MLDSVLINNEENEEPSVSGISPDDFYIFPKNNGESSSAPSISPVENLS